MLVGYARVSSEGQSLDIQKDALIEAGCEKVFAEKLSGRSAKDRQQLHDAIDFVRAGDTLVVTRLDRLARSVGDLHQIIEKLAEKNVAFRCLNQSGVDTDSSTGKLMIGILSAVACFENDIRRERQMEGIAKAKAEGRYKGRPATIDPNEVKALKEKGLGASQIAREMNIGRASVSIGHSQLRAPQNGSQRLLRRLTSTFRSGARSTALLHVEPKPSIAMIMALV